MVSNILVARECLLFVAFGLWYFMYTYHTPFQSNRYGYKLNARHLAVERTGHSISFNGDTGGFYYLSHATCCRSSANVMSLNHALHVCLPLVTSRPRDRRCRPPLGDDGNAVRNAARGPKTSTANWARNFGRRRTHGAKLIKHNIGGRRICRPSPGHGAATGKQRCHGLVLHV